VRQFVCALETWIIVTLAQFNVNGEHRAGRAGVRVEREGYEDKIAAIGVKLRRWVSFHGISINVEPDLAHFDGIVPCGIKDHGVTSLVDLGLPVTMTDLDVALRATFLQAFPTREQPALGSVFLANLTRLHHGKVHVQQCATCPSGCRLMMAAGPTQAE
jgi:lipoyl(octanoyl) transferase